MRALFRHLGLAAFVATAFLAAPAPAQARSYSSSLEIGSGGAGMDAEGRIRFQPRVRGDRVKVALRNLEPFADYEIRDGITGTVLAEVTTNRRGRARASFRAERLPGGETVSLAGLPLEVCRPGEDAPVLEGNVPDKGDNPGKGPPDDRPRWDDCTYRIGQVSTEPGSGVQVSLVVSSTKLPDLDHAYDSISLYVGPDFYTQWLLPPGGDDGGGGTGPEPIAEPVTFWLADGDGVLQKVAVLESSGEFVPLPCVIDDDAKDVALAMADGGIGGVIDCEDRSGDGSDGSVWPSSYFWYADNTSEEGLPFGVGGVDDLVGREFEVRDGADGVLLGGKVPELETIDCSPPPVDDFTFEIGTVSTEPDAAVAVSITLSSMGGGGLDKPYDSISLFVSPNVYWVYTMDGLPDLGDLPTIVDIPGPVTFAIEDGGELVVVATVEEGGGVVPLGEGMDPAGFPGDTPPDWYPSFFSWYADNASGEGLPLGVDAVKELSGRKFEVRDGEKNLLLEGVLPDLEPLKAEDPGMGGGIVFPDGSVR